MVHFRGMRFTHSFDASLNSVLTLMLGLFDYDSAVVDSGNQLLLRFEWEGAVSDEIARQVNRMPRPDFVYLDLGRVAQGTYGRVMVL